MEDAELVGGVLLSSPDIPAAANALARLLESGKPDASSARNHGLDPELVAALRTHFTSAPQRIREACALGAAWASGRVSAPLPAPWELVASWPKGDSLPPGLRRTTAETLVYLVNSATVRIRLAAPFMDETGVGYLTVALVSATRRQVAVELFLPTRSTHGARAVAELEAAAGRDGDLGCLSTVGLRPESPWAHLKVLTADGSRAYLGSANFTGPGLGGANLELGVLVVGSQVQTIDAMFQRFREK